MDFVCFCSSEEEPFIRIFFLTIVHKQLVEMAEQVSCQKIMA